MSSRPGAEAKAPGGKIVTPPAPIRLQSADNRRAAGPEFIGDRTAAATDTIVGDTMDWSWLLGDAEFYVVKAVELAFYALVVAGVVALAERLIAKIKSARAAKPTMYR